MQRALSLILWISRIYPKLSSLFVAMVVLLIDIVTDKAFQFPLFYVVPVGMAAWRKQRMLAYCMAVTLPVLRLFHESPVGGGAPLSEAGLNLLIEIASMALYAFLVDKSAARTGQLKKSITSKDLEIDQLRSFTRILGTPMQGRGLSPGMAEGTAWIFHPPESDPDLTFEPIGPQDVEAEISRLNAALKTSISELEAVQMRFAGDTVVAESVFMDVQLVMLSDAGFWDKCRHRVREELIKAEQAVSEEIRGMVAKLEEMKQDIMRERGADVKDIGLRVLRNMGSATETASQCLASLPPHTILVAKELLPSDMFHLDLANLAGVVTERNSPASHVAILARTRNIPAVSDIKDATALLATGDHLLLDAHIGSVTVAPTSVQKERFIERKSQYVTRECAEARDEAQGSATKDGVHIGLLANISKPDEARLALEYRLEGVGLYRSEFLFLDVAQPPTLDAQTAAYSAVASMLSPSPVTIRTMDFGGDKIPQFSHTESALAFRMGKRGLAFSLAEKTMFRTQLQAILRSAQVGDVRIMFPMVTGVADMREAQQFVEEVAQSEHVSKRVSIGAMIETPASVIHFREIAKMVDFVSIGTNDLSHFILATDRQAQGASAGAAFLHPSVLRATEHVVQMALEQGISLSVCGEAAGNPLSACLLVGMGVRNLSMNPFQAASIRCFLQKMTLEQMETVAREALAAPTQEMVQQIVSHAFRE
jgi:phosphotransferase system enzyme I (PtsI)